MQVAVGASDGCLDGLGDRVGFGDFVGFGVETVGSLEGRRDGDSLGSLVGLSVGDADGRSVGRSVGDFDGIGEIDGV